MSAIGVSRSMSPLVARNVHADVSWRCPLLNSGKHLLALSFSGFDPMRTSANHAPFHNLHHSPTMLWTGEDSCGDASLWLVWVARQQCRSRRAHNRQRSPIAWLTSL